MWRTPLTFVLILLAATVRAQGAALPTLQGARFLPGDPTAASIATFAAGLSVDGDVTLRTSARPGDLLQLNGYIRPEPSHVGQHAELFVVARTDGGFFMRLPGGAWAPWNSRVADLQAFRTDATLAAENVVEVFTGRIGAAAAYLIFLGYRVDDGVLRYTPQAQRIDISDNAAAATTVTWNFDGAAWQPGGAAPACPNPLLETPVDLPLVTSVLYPGQVRGGNYKPHGGFRFDGGQGNDITVSAALGGTVYRGVRYIEAGEVQYMFDIVNSCGVMLRYDHLRELSPKFAAIAATLPIASAATTTTQLSGYSVSAGETLATSIGYSGNVFVDFGVYDLQVRNPAAPQDGELAPFGTCWLDALPAADSALIRSLPAADGLMGKTSDYCQ